MTNEPCQPTPADPARHQPSAARPETDAYWDGTRQPDPTDRYMAMLDRCAALGMRLIESLAAEAEEMIAARRAAAAARRAAAPAETPAAPAEPAPAEPVTLPEAEPAEPELTVEELVARDPAYLAFQRLTRSLRQCMALALRFQNDRLDREAGLIKGRAAAAAAAPKPPREPSRKEQLADLVKDKIEREAEPDEKEDLLSELRERLEEEDVELDLEKYPLDELALLICQDLGAGPDGDFRGTGTLISEYLVVEPPLQPGEPIREGETLRMEEPRPLHIIRRLNRDQKRKQKQKPPSG